MIFGSDFQFSSQSPSSNPITLNAWIWKCDCKTNPNPRDFISNDSEEPSKMLDAKLSKALFWDPLKTRNIRRVRNSFQLIPTAQISQNPIRTLEKSAYLNQFEHAGAWLNSLVANYWPGESSELEEGLEDSEDLQVAEHWGLRSATQKSVKNWPSCLQVAVLRSHEAASLGVARCLRWVITTGLKSSFWRAKTNEANRSH